MVLKSIFVPIQKGSGNCQFMLKMA